MPIGVNNQVKPIVRQKSQPLSQSKSPLKRTEELISPLKRTFAIRQGLQSLAGFRLKLTPMGNAVSLQLIWVGKRHHP